MADKAILFGVNNYRTISDLRGCKNDLKDVRRLLTESYGFEPKNIKTYADAKVVKKAVEKGFDWLAKGSQPGDRLVFHFSGHGSYTTSTSSDKDLDELICLYDMDWNDEDTFIRDTDLGRLTRKVDSGARLTVILDSCHSGSGTRGVTAGMRAAANVTSRTGLIIIQDTAKQLARQRGEAADHAEGIAEARAGTMRMLKQDETPPVFARFVEPPVAIQQARAKRRALRVRALGESVRAELNHQLLAAAHEKQTAADAFIDGDYHGAFSFYLCDTARADTDESFQTVMKKTAQRIEAEGYGQDPQIEGPFSTETIFGGTPPSDTFDELDHVDHIPDPKDQEQLATLDSNQIGSCDSSDAALGVPTGGSGPLETLNQLLRVSEKLIDLSRPIVADPMTVAAEIGRGVQNEVIVYVHGINNQPSGYSIPWHNAIRPHLAHPIRRAEVRWSQHVNARAIAESADRTAEADSFDAQVQAELERRLERVDEIAAQRAAMGQDREVMAMRVERPRSFLLDDFVRYMVVKTTRELILREFTRIVVPELQAGRQVHIVSHSWGTVVAFEGMRRLDQQSFPGRVANLFVAGSALSIGAVQSNLFGRIGNGRTPVHVRRIINLDAGGDVVGGPIGDVFTVDREFLGLDPTGCRKIPFTGIAINPVCAHSSYFVRQNRAVNRNIFAAHINQT